VRCWGSNDRGELGDGTSLERLTYVEVGGLPASATAVASAYSHTCALLDTGAVWCWATTQFGNVGDGTFDAFPEPFEVVPAGSGVVAVSGGALHTCALLDTGGVECWGDDARFQLGVVPRTIYVSPVSVPDLAGIVDLAAGSEHTCAVSASRGLSCWGLDDHGQATGDFHGYPHPVSCRPGPP